MSSSRPYMQYGCGSSCPKIDGWVNFDASPTLYLQRIPGIGFLFRRLLKPVFARHIVHGDILKSMPGYPGGYAGIYCSHVLEHLSLKDARLALKNTYDLLAPGGYFRLVMPDLELLVGEYHASEAAGAAITLMQQTGLGVTRRDRSVSRFLRSYLGNSTHLWLWDFKAIKHELEQTGFSLVRRAYYGDSADPRFAEVEDAPRWLNCLGVECQRL